MAVTGNTQLAATKQDIITALVQKELAFQAKLLPTVTDVSSFAAKGQKSIAFPKFGSFTVENRASGVAASLQDLTATADKLDLNRRATVGWLIDSMDELQSSVEVQAEYVKRATSAHARDVDSQIITALIAGSGFSAGGGPITAAKILSMREQLVKSHANMAQLSMVIDPTNETALLQLAEFSRADYYGSSNIPSGMIGRIYGMPVLVHAGMPPGEALVYDKEALAIGFQRGPQYDEVKDPRYGTGSVVAVVDQLYGVKVMQDGSLGEAAGTSPLIAKLLL